MVEGGTDAKRLNQITVLMVAMSVGGRIESSILYADKIHLCGNDGHGLRRDPEFLSARGTGRAVYHVVLAVTGSVPGARSSPVDERRCWAHPVLQRRVGSCVMSAATPAS